MKTKFYLTCLALLIASMAQAQSKFGNATPEELSMTTYAADSTTSAVYLIKNGDTRIVYSSLHGFQIEHTIKSKIKILTEEGLEECNQLFTRYEITKNYKEVTKSLSGTTYNLEDDKVVKIKMNKENISIEEDGEHMKITKFTLPGAKVGSVIEFSYTIVSDLWQNFPSFNFQSDIPVQSTLLTITIPEYFVYNLNFQGYEKVESKIENVNDSFHYSYRDYNGQLKSDRHQFLSKQYKFDATNIPALRDGDYIWNAHDYITQISFELHSTQMPNSLIKTYTSDWASVDDQITKARSFSSNLNKKGLFKDLVTPGELTIDTAHDVLNLVKSKVSWNNKFGIYPQDLKKALESGSGSVADVNFLLLNALKAAGFDAYPVLLSTRSHGVLPKHPTVNAFNYIVIAMEIGEKQYFADATSRFSSWNLLPLRASVEQARLMREKKTEWCNLFQPASGSHIIMSEVKYVDGKKQMKITDKRTGYSAYNLRYNRADYNNEEEFIKNFASADMHEIEGYETRGLNETVTPTIISYTKTTDEELDSEHLYINPLTTNPYSSNPFSKEKRVLPVFFDNPKQIKQIVHIHIPQGYEVAELPDASQIVLGDNEISLTYQFAVNGNILNAAYDFRINKTMFLPNEYEFLRDTFEQIIAKNNIQIVLKRKSENASEIVTDTTIQ